MSNESPSIMDIAPLSEEVTIRRRQYPVYPITAEGMTYLISSFPEIGTILEGRGATLEAGHIMSMSTDVIAIVCAMALLERGGFPDRPAWLNSVKKLAPKVKSFAVAEQLSILSKSFEITFPEGAGPFVGQITKFMNGVGMDLGASQQSQLRSGTPESVTGLGGQFSAALQTGMAPPPGPTPSGNSTDGSLSPNTTEQIDSSTNSVAAE